MNARQNTSQRDEKFAENEKKGQSKYEETRSMLYNLLNDTDGSYAKKLVAENPGEVTRFSENNVQQQQELAERENRNMQQQEEPQRSFSRSV